MPRPRRRHPPPEPAEPGRSGPHATTQAHEVGAVVISYNPDTDGDPDPGEIVWTWVPYEENDGRGKDRPVLIVAREPAGTVLGVQLSSQDHDDDREWVPIGAGAWDGEGRRSWVNLERVLRVSPLGMRREAAALEREQFEVVIARLRERYRWRSAS
ncbi:MAG: type II toxin-antitoxin system PemK/MazF family toxin [Jiangellaceae bacterium]